MLRSRVVKSGKTNTFLSINRLTVLALPPYTRANSAVGHVLLRLVAR